MKKGFTLIEMIAVVGLIGLICLLVLPNIVNQLGTKKQEISETTEQLIYSATEIYLSDNNITTTGEVTLEKLVDKGYLKTPLKDFNCGEEISLSKKVVYTLNTYGQFDLNIDLSCSED